MHAFNCCLDLALTYSMRRPELARRLCRDAIVAAMAVRNPEAIYRANELLAAIGGAS